MMGASNESVPEMVIDDMLYIHLIPHSCHVFFLIFIVFIAFHRFSYVFHRFSYVFHRFS